MHGYVVYTLFGTCKINTLPKFHISPETFTIKGNFTFQASILRGRFLLSFTGVSGFQGKKHHWSVVKMQVVHMTPSSVSPRNLTSRSCNRDRVRKKTSLWRNGRRKWCDGNYDIIMFGKLILWNRLGSCRTWDLFDSFFGVQQLHKLLLATVWQATVSWAMCLNSIHCSKFCLHLCIPQREGILCHVDLSGLLEDLWRKFQGIHDAV